ncbi:adenine phosphoribosyltransferase [Mycoplasmoides pirum]|uniref:adenine phosphoribosyltransferase n=1 Tax=Mycoplasmoides pirum TaxID=2122 RepID=UPI000481555D|nr:adenine phosphoribosyltransferase [Mycoplasmoides pirum]
MTEKILKKIDAKIYKVRNFPIKDMLFYDIMPVINDSELFCAIINQMKGFAKKIKAEAIIAPESRGFIFGAALAYAAKLPFIVVRKPKKLPRKTLRENYSLEYNDNASLEIHEDAILPNQKLLLVDDLLATAGTVGAISRLIKKSKGKLIGYSFLIELEKLKGRKSLNNKLPLNVIIKY